MAAIHAIENFANYLQQQSAQRLRPKVHGIVEAWLEQ
jgi:hypothetical protein